MHFHILSDLHLEFGPADIPDTECDCVILAGDISTKHHGLEWIRERFPSIPVVYVLGNHEYYGAKYPSLIESLRQQAKGTNIHLLEDDSVTIGDVSLFGCTLWTDFALHGDVMVASLEAGGSMNDYKRIRNTARGYRKLSPVDTRMAHANSLLAMHSFFECHDPARSVIATHHAPSILSLPEFRREERISGAYTSRLDPLILKYEPKLWVHGHIHHSNDYMIGSTRILANPRAYPDQPNPNFQPGLCVEVR